ncbi:MAG: hypothetical protein LBT98_03855 [Puniceicoccales bacterium]|jgi:hypothetical protein|nr:hypothetical protein [Puniceicoccales bacterium]
MNASMNNLVSFFPTFVHPDAPASDSQRISVPPGADAVGLEGALRLDPLIHEKACAALAKYANDRITGCFKPSGFGTIQLPGECLQNWQRLSACLNKYGPELKKQLREKQINTRDLPSAMRARWEFEKDGPLNTNQDLTCLSCDVFFLLGLLEGRSLPLSEILNGPFRTCALLSSKLPFPCHGDGIMLTKPEMVKYLGREIEWQLDPGMCWVFWVVYQVVSDRLEANPNADPLPPVHP